MRVEAHSAASGVERGRRGEGARAHGVLRLQGALEVAGLRCWWGRGYIGVAGWVGVWWWGEFVLGRSTGLYIVDSDISSTEESPPAAVRHPAEPAAPAGASPSLGAPSASAAAGSQSSGDPAASAAASLSPGAPAAVPAAPPVSAEDVSRAIANRLAGRAASGKAAAASAKAAGKAVGGAAKAAGRAVAAKAPNVFWALQLLSGAGGACHMGVG